jgi:multisite-specific tRNA:(cytosine-C5)-methyltransferase
MRLIPQDQDTGGFFVCVFEKAADAKPTEPAAELPEVSTMEEVTVADESGPSSLKREASPSGIEGAEPDTKKSKPTKKRKPDPQFKEDAYSFVDPEHDEVKSIM